MTRLTILLLLIGTLQINAQPLFQNNYIPYLGSSLNGMSLGNNSVFSYNGLGKRFFIENYPTSLNSGVMTTHVPKGLSPMVFGMMSLFAPGEYKDFVQLSGSHFGEMDFTAKVNFRTGYPVRHLFLVNGRYLNQQRDSNEDEFMDLPLRKRLFLFQSTSVNYKKLSSNIGSYFLKVHNTGGQMGFEKEEHQMKPDLYGFGDEVTQGGLYFNKKYKLPIARNKYKQEIFGNMAARWHRQDSWFGLRPLEARENHLEAFLGYRADRVFSEFQTGLKYRKLEKEQTFDSLQMDRDEKVFGWFGSFRQFFWGKFQLKSYLHLDYHNMEEWELHPGIKVNFQQSKDLLFGVFSGSGYQFENVLAENNRYLLSSRKVSFEGETASRAWYYGAVAQVYPRDWLNFDGHLFFQLQYYHRFYQKGMVLDLDSNVELLQIYPLDGKASRQTLEGAAKITFSRKAILHLLYRYDIAKTTVEGRLRELPFHSRHQWHTKIQFAFFEHGFPTKLNLLYLLRSSQRLPDGGAWNGGNTPFVHRLDCRLTFRLPVSRTAKQFPERVSFFVGMDNVLNQWQRKLYYGGEAPFSNQFDGGMLWGNLTGRRLYVGFRYGEW